MLTVLQTYRGFAAMLVVFFHSALAAKAYFGEQPLLDVFIFGSSGVQFFFALSGFIIYYIHRADIDQPAALPNYALKRLIRIYPIYILVTLAFAPLWLFVPSIGEPFHKDVGALLLSLLLVPQSHFPHLGVAWTLTHEMLFYFVFATLIIRRSLGLALLAVWAAAIVVANLLADGELTLPLRYFVSTNNLLFMLGMFAARLAIARRWQHVALFVLGNILFLAVGAWTNTVGMQPDPFEYNLMVAGFGVASFLILLQAEAPALQRFFANRRLLLLLGDASYSIYLIHYPLVSATCKVLKYLGLGAGNTLIAFVVAAAFSAAAGVALHLIVEKPMLRWLGRRYRTQRRVVAA
ncbi:MAG TPA: acyltransferase [Steroidobacteraceae bacterium]|nr:acyltransferase [Steroidobacteraceae bacterium]